MTLLEAARDVARQAFDDATGDPLDAALHAYTEVLRNAEALRLPDEPLPEPTDADRREAAQWLAGRSNHPRYGGDLWESLLTSEANVEHAYAAAVAQRANCDGDVLAALRVSRDMLLDHIRGQR